MSPAVATAPALALTMLPPWSWAIVHAGKRLENRDWKRGCSYRGPVWLHTNIVGTVERREDAKGAFGLGTWDDSPSGLYRRALKPVEAAWWTGGFALLLDNVVALPEAVSCKGALGFWKVPEDVEAKCLAQLPEAP